MAIVKMSKLVLLGVRDDESQILDTLFDSKLVQLKSSREIENTNCFYDETKANSYIEKCGKIERAISLIEAKLPPTQKIENCFDVSSQEFEKTCTKIDDLEGILANLDDLQSKILENKKERANLENKINQLLPYVDVKESFCDFKPTKHTNIFLGILPTSSIKDFNDFIKDFPLTIYEFCGSEGNVLKVFSHNLESNLIVKKLNELGFSKCNLNYEKNASEEIKNLKKLLTQLDRDDEKTNKEFLSFETYLKDLKIARDYLKFCIEKVESEELFRSTESSFVLEGFLAQKDEKKLAKVLDKFDSIEYEFVRPQKDEMPPTITKNGIVTRQFEFVTNMYSAPHYGELDPNFFIFIFFSLFFGFIMADIGYGLCLVVFGAILSLKEKRKTGFKTLMNVLIVGGFATILFGVLFGSFFGVSNDTWSFVPQAILPNPVTNVITMLVACLAAGVVQIMVSFFLKGVLLIKRGHPLQAIFSAFLWDTFFVGLALFALEFANVYVGLGTIGIIIAGSSVGLSVLGLFLINKGFERVSKSFGALYGIINLFSDILSYARLFGLMLSGAIIASIVNQLAEGFLTSIATFAIGAIILAIGHAFNLAMGALGAYIHVARLQYIEFFSRFYEGEGELFVPFGQTNFSYVNLIK